MNDAVLVARALLALTFVVAAAGKLGDRRGTREAVAGFGVPGGIVRPVAELLAPAELAVAALLLPAATALAGSAAALALLVAFTAAIGVNLLRGRAPDCHCFGALHSEPVGPRTLARNGALTALAAFAVGESAAGRVPGFGSHLGIVLGGVAAVTLVAGGVLAYVSLLQSYGRVLVRLDRVERALAAHGVALEDDEPELELGLPPGTPAPSFAELPSLLAPGVPLLLLFTSTRCGPCQALLPTAAEWQRGLTDSLTVAFATSGEPDEVRAHAGEFGLANVVHDEELAIYEAFRANGTPSAVLVGPDGAVASHVASGPDAVERLLQRTLAARDRGLRVGVDAPPLVLPSLDGGQVALTELRGRDTLLLFWNPDCGYCRALHERVLDWERRTNGEGPRLVVVAAGDRERLRADGFRSLVLVDEGFAAGSAFGAGGTPTAVLLDADGRVASQLAAGGDAVMALAAR